MVDEYLRLYHKMAGLISDSIVDVAPLCHVAGAFMLGRRIIIAAFIP